MTILVLQLLGVSKISRELKLELGNWETKEPVPVAKNKKTEDPSSGPGFWHLVITRKPEPGVYIYKIIFFNIFCYQYIYIF
jgi:hypothetical protein